MGSKKPKFAQDAHSLQPPHGRNREQFFPLRVRVEELSQSVEMDRSPAILGRHSEADLRLPWPDISRRHCRLVFKEGRWWIQDLESLNGILLNGERVVEGVLYTGDIIRVGSVLLTVERGSPGRRIPSQVIQSIASVLPTRKI